MKEEVVVKGFWRVLRRSPPSDLRDTSRDVIIDAGSGVGFVKYLQTA
jgi:hypothetical protein